MFSKAYQIARQFTLPVVISRRTVGGECSATIATAVLINDEGWIVSAAHVFDEMSALVEQEVATAAAQQEIARIEADASLNRHERRRLLAQTRKPKRDDVERWSVWLGRPGKIERVLTLTGADLAVAQLVDFHPNQAGIYPTFQEPARGYEPGVSLCRLGFPLHEIVPTYEPENRLFRLPPEATPLPIFPNEGILTRFIEIVPPTHPVTGEPLPQPPFPIRMFETSTAALPGQSGGPIVDTEGRVWGIQSMTISYALDLQTKEQQYYHVGVGVHAETILGLFKAHGIKYDPEP